MQFAIEGPAFIGSGSENTLWELGENLFSTETGFSETEVLEVVIKIHIQDFMPPPMRAKEFQKMDGKTFSHLESLSCKKDFASKTAPRATAAALRTLSPSTPLQSPRSLFFPKESSQTSLEKKSSSSANPKQHSATSTKEALLISKNSFLSTLGEMRSKHESTETHRPVEKPSSSYALSEHKTIKEADARPMQERQQRQEKEGKRERQAFQEDSDNDNEQAKKEKKRGLKAISGVDTSFSHSKNPSHVTTGNEGGQPTRKPFIEPPKLGVFALYYMLDKMGIYSESTSYHQYKQEIEMNEAERSLTHKNMIDEMQKAIDKEKQTARWSIMMKVFSWIGSLTSIIAGAFMVATGVGAIAGAILIAGGVIALANQMMELTGGWEKVVDLLPGDDLEKKRAVVTWMQIGVGVLSLILAGAGIIFGGYSAFGEASQTTLAIFHGIVLAGSGVCSIGKGIEDYFYKNRKGEAKKYELRLVELKHMRQDVMDKVDESPDRLLHYYESLARNLGFLEEMNKAYQRAWR